MQRGGSWWFNLHSTSIRQMIEAIRKLSLVDNKLAVIPRGVKRQSRGHIS
jgi:hypothetical protein